MVIWFYTVSNAHVHNTILNFIASLISVGIPVILGPSEVIYRPGEGPVELTCVRNTTVGSTLWRVNGSGAVTPYGIGTVFPGHGYNGVNLVINDPSNNTEYICVTSVDNMDSANSEPVYLYVAGMYVVSLQ